MLKKALLILCAALFILCLFSCGGENAPEETETSSSNTQTSDPIPSQDPSKLNFSGITFADSTIDYDGQSHTLTVSNAPAFATVTYSNAGPFTNAGTYTVTAAISADNYNTLTLTGKLSINKIDFSGVSFADGKFEYDGNSHEISVSGNLPANAVVTYSSNVEGINNSAVQIGVYEITATVTEQNFNELVLTAKLTINATDEERAMLVSQDTLFFQNALDDNKLYAYYFPTDTLIKVSNDTAVDMISKDNNAIYFTSKTLLASSIKTASYDVETSSASVAGLLNKSARYIQKGAGSLYYFAYNGLTNAGIYKADLSGQEPIVTCISEGKAKYLQLYDNTLFFADGSNGDKLSKISITANNPSRQLVVDEKINNLVFHDGALFFTVNKLLGDYIARYTISNGVVRKLTSDAGTNFAFVGESLYYVCVDKLTSLVIGNGIYKVEANRDSDNNGHGTKVIDGGDLGVCSLIANGTDLFYYDVNGYHLVQYSTTNQTSTDLLEGFTKPADPAPTSFGSQVKTANGIVYYLDIYDGKTLHSYNPTTKANYRLTSEKVDNFSIIGDFIYLNMVSFGVNNDLYRMNYKTGEAPVLVNTYDATDMISDGVYLYFIEENATGTPKAIHKSALDGTNDVVIYNDKAASLCLYNGTLYYASTSGTNIICKINDVANVTTAQTKTPVNSDYKGDTFTIENGVIYFRQNYGVAYLKHRLAKMNVDGTGYAEMVTASTDPSEIIVENGYVYYANAAETATDYDLYRVAINGTTAQELTTDMRATCICVLGNDVYFVDYLLGGTLGDSHLYSVPTTGGEPVQIH